MRTAKTDQTGRMPRLIWVFAGRTYHFVGFVMRGGGQMVKWAYKYFQKASIILSSVFYIRNYLTRLGASFTEGCTLHHKCICYCYACRENGFVKLTLALWQEFQWQLEQFEGLNNLLRRAYRTLYLHIIASLIFCLTMCISFVFVKTGS